jgi:hypothetical protein
LALFLWLPFTSTANLPQQRKVVVAVAHQVVGAVAQTPIPLSHTAVRRNTDAQIIVKNI